MTPLKSDKPHLKKQVNIDNNSLTAMMIILAVILAILLITGVYFIIAATSESGPLDLDSLHTPAGSNADYPYKQEISVTVPPVTDDTEVIPSKSDSSDGIYSEFAALIDVTDNTIIASKKAAREIYPASMAKVMTLIVVIENLKTEDAMQEELTISAEVVDRMYAEGSSGFGFKAGEKLTVEALLHALILQSDGIAANTLAEYVAGSESAFVELMNAKAAELGMKNTTFNNPCGLDEENGSIYHENAELWKEREDYRGIIEVIEEEDGFVVINELPIEEYLYSVVPSEMPASYPIEALKAQAICARTYAYLHVLSPGYPKWNAHVDDTTAYQVYHSVEECVETTGAVNETEGMVLCAPGGNELAQTYYYSTSCGYGSDAHVWRSKYSDSYPYIKSRHISRGAKAVFYNSDDTGAQQIKEEEFVDYIKNINKEDYEAQEGWYRWTYRVEDLDTERMLKILQLRYAVNEKLILTQKGDDFISQPIEELGNVYDIQICIGF